MGIRVRTAETLTSEPLVTAELARADAQQLLEIADIGLEASMAYGRITVTGRTERALAELRRAVGAGRAAAITLTLARVEMTALIAVAEFGVTGLKVFARRETARAQRAVDRLRRTLPAH